VRIRRYCRHCTNPTIPPPLCESDFTTTIYEFAINVIQIQHYRWSLLYELNVTYESVPHSIAFVQWRDFESMRGLEYGKILSEKVDLLYFFFQFFPLFFSHLLD
jgi:hypothetical protein